MFLEKLEIQGFKSFANKNQLVFPGIISGRKRGLTAIVGPNGSGKSNVADAVRWALGEQSLKTLRGKKSDDVIFSGSDKKGRLGLAEVSLFLNNSDKSSLNDLNATNAEGATSEAALEEILRKPEIVITRRIFRDGDSEYLLNNNRVRLTDVQMLLAKAHFGQKTYSVIGQGLVEGFLNTSLAERKDFFDEATGVKQYQIKRDLSLNKLQGSYENLNQVEVLLNEIEPRLKSLTRQVNRLERREEIETELKDLQLKYYRRLWHEINDKFNVCQNNCLEIEKNKGTAADKLAELNSEIAVASREDSGIKEYNDLQNSAAVAQGERDKIIKELHRFDALLEVKLENSGQFDLSFLNNKSQEIKEEKIKINAEIKLALDYIEVEKQKVSVLFSERQELNEKFGALNNELMKLSSSAGDDNLQKISRQLEKSLAKLESAESFDDLDNLKEALAEIKEELKAALNLAAGKSDETAFIRLQKEIEKLSAHKEELSDKINNLNLEINSRVERRRLLEEKSQALDIEEMGVIKKIGQFQKAPDTDKINAERQELDKRLNALDKDLNNVREKISAFNKSQETQRLRIFEIQKNSQTLQAEVNHLGNQLNEVKIDATRYETRLEDLETEIRQFFPGLKEIRETRTEEDFDLEPVAEKIASLRKQLEAIGGIDPEVVKEYSTTKERYDFLFTQTDDLQKAIKSLEKIIFELDIIIKERFDSEFKIISEKFSEYFKILFNGGVAKIVKVMANSDDDKKEATSGVDEKVLTTDEKEVVEANRDQQLKFLKKHNATGLAGIEIEATPPGKKIRSISMLSGGERALTAIALICAIISANPSPFVVLDEVDAALDEANSERLAKILDDLSNKTQFIVITHNRAPMRRASILYGVTMPADGISQLLSVKLDDVKVD